MIDYGDDKKAAAKHEEMRQRYRNVFSTEEGNIVMGDIMQACHVGVPLNPDEKKDLQTVVAEYNVGVYILRMAGYGTHIDSLLGIGKGE